MKNKTWGLVDSFFDKYDIVDHHIKSYNWKSYTKDYWYHWTNYYRKWKRKLHS